MDIIHFFLDIVLHLDKHLAALLAEYGTLTYIILIAIVFTETGLIVMPLLPGDSLLFAAGALASSTGKLDIKIIIISLILATLLGDNINYLAGKFFGGNIKKRQCLLFFKHEHLKRTESFYAEHGGKTVIMARFIPIIRTIAPFVAGAGSMRYSRYILFCIIGAALWVVSLSLLGYQFGNLEIVRNNFEIVILSIIFISLMPIIIHYIKEKYFQK